MAAGIADGIPATAFLAQKRLAASRLDESNQGVPILLRHYDSPHAVKAVSLSLSFVSFLAAAALGADPAALFEENVKPLLAHHCYDCHSEKSKELKGNLKLDSLEGIMKGGANGPAVVAGDVENSFLLRAIRYQEADYQMPPSGRLSDEEIAGIEAWVKALKDRKSRPAKK
jgi:mono/diheme cytochrome c family protein